MSGFSAPYYESSQGRGTGAQQDYYAGSSRQTLPNYNSNYEQRYQSMQNNYNDGSKTANTPMYSHSVHRPLSVNVYEIRFKCTKGDYLLAHSVQVKPGDFVQVEADRGYDVGVVFKKKNMTPGVEIPRKRILGHVTPDEMSILPHKIAEETQATLICRQMAAQRGLLITIADVEFQFDRNKLTVVFASEGRVDFRELVRDMFSFFRIRIWMQKVSPSEALVLMELAAADNAGRSGRGVDHRSHSPTMMHQDQQVPFTQHPSLSHQSLGSGGGAPIRFVPRVGSESSSGGGDDAPAVPFTGSRQSAILPAGASTYSPNVQPSRPLSSEFLSYNGYDDNDAGRNVTNGFGGASGGQIDNSIRFTSDQKTITYSFDNKKKDTDYNQQLPSYLSSSSHSPVRTSPSPRHSIDQGANMSFPSSVGHRGQNEDNSEIQQGAHPSPERVYPSPLQNTD